MNNVISFPSRDHVIIERLMVRQDDGSVTPRYFVSPVFDGGRCFGDFDSEDYAEARTAAADYALPIVDQTAAQP